MHIVLKFLKIVLEIAFIMITYYIIANFFSVLYEVCILCWIAVSILILLFNYNFFSILFTKKEKSEKKQLFNIYYINHPKVFEICMLINNKRKSHQELSIKDEETQKKSLSLGGTFSKKSVSVIPTIANENSNIKTYEYKELQEIKETNSTYLSEIINKCKNINDKNLTNGSLVKLDDVSLQIVNKDEIAQINSMLSGIFKDSNISTVSDGQTFNIDINAIGNILLKDYKYSLKGITSNKKIFYISIPIKTEKEFENDYSIYDLEVGKVNIIGIYRTDKYIYKNNSTFNYLQEIGEEEQIVGEELLKSNTPNNKTKNQNNKEKQAIYIDLIAIVQDLDITGGKNNE